MAAASIFLVSVVILLGIGPAGALAQGLPVQDWSIAHAASATIEVLKRDGSPLRETRGSVIGEPGRLLVRMSALAGGDRAVIRLADGRSLAAEQVSAFDADNDLALLETTGSLPLAPDRDETIKWLYSEKVVVVAGFGAARREIEATTTEPLELDGLQRIPVTGNPEAGLTVMHNCGRWCGITGRVEDPTGSFSYVTPVEAVNTLLGRGGAARRFADLPPPTPTLADPRSPKGLLLRAVLADYTSPDRARPYYDLALKVDPKLPETHYWLGKHHFKKQAHAESEAAFREAARLRPTWAFAFHMAGAVANQQGNYAGAIELYDQALAVNPRSAMTLTNKAGALYNLGRLDDSIESLKRAIEIDPTYAVAVHNLAVTYLSAGNRLEAEDLYERLRSMDERLAQSLRNRLDRP